MLRLRRQFVAPVLITSHRLAPILARTLTRAGTDSEDPSRRLRMPNCWAATFCMELANSVGLTDSLTTRKTEDAGETHGGR